MNILPVKIKAVIPPRDNLLLKVYASKFKPKNGDVIAITSKVVGIHEGRCVSTRMISKDALAKQEAALYLERKHTPGGFALHTIHHGVLIRNAGIDESNGNGYYILWPKNPRRSAQLLRQKLMKKYKLSKLGVLITDSISTPLRRGAIGFALAWDGFDPLYDYRGTKDIFGRTFVAEQSNLADALAAAAVLTMGEGGEQTPVAIIRNVPKAIWHPRHTNKGWNTFSVPLKDDLFAPFLTRAPWKKGGDRSK